EQRYWNFYRAGQLDAALAEARKLRELVLQRLGEVHPNYAMVLNYEANVLEAQGRIRDAEVLYKRALAIDESLQGYEPNVARDLSNLAINVQKQLRYDEAEGLYRRAISLFERHAANSVRFAMDLNNLAVFYSSIGRYADAEGLLKRALPILARQTRGADRALIATAMVNLGFAYVGQGRYDEGRRFTSEATRSLSARPAPATGKLPTNPCTSLPNSIIRKGATQRQKRSISAHSASCSGPLGWIGMAPPSS